MKLHLGCGRDIREDWVNVDIRPWPGVDVIADLEKPLPFDDNTVEEFLLVHVAEHIRNIKGLMQELHRIATPDALAVFKTPYEASDEAWADPDHVRVFNWKSWPYYGQPFYWRTPDPYKGDWRVERVLLILDPGYQGMPPSEIRTDLKTLRNVVMEMVAFLRAVKPIRPPDRELQERVALQFAIGRLAP